MKRCERGLIDRLRGEQGSDEQRKAALYYAYTETFETDDRIPDRSPNMQREERMLRHFQSEEARKREEMAAIGSGGYKFEREVRDRLRDLGLPERARVFRIQSDNGDISYKEMDVHTRVDTTPIIAELYTQRFRTDKRGQLENYAELYRIATGFSPESYLVTRDERRAALDDALTLAEFEHHLRDKYDLVRGRGEQ